MLLKDLSRTFTKKFKTMANNNFIFKHIPDKEIIKLYVYFSVT